MPSEYNELVILTTCKPLSTKLDYIHTVMYGAQMDSDDLRHEIGGRLTLAIEGLGRLPIEIAREFDISPARLSNWMRGRAFPDPVFMIRLAAAYGSAISLDYIFLGRDVLQVSRVLEAVQRAAASPSARQSQQAAPPMSGTRRNETR